MSGIDTAAYKGNAYNSARQLNLPTGVINEIVRAHDEIFSAYPIVPQLSAKISGAVNVNSNGSPIVSTKPNFEKDASIFF